MYAIVKTGGKQYKVAPGDKLNVEKLPAEVGDKVTLDAICIVDGKKVEPDASKAAATKVEAVVLEQFRDKKVLVFKFKKRKNYKKLRGHRQSLTRIQIVSVGSEKYEEPKAKKASAAKSTSKKDSEEAEEKKAASKASSSKAKKPAASKSKESTAKATKATASKTTAKKTTKAKVEDKTEGDSKSE